MHRKQQQKWTQENSIDSNISAIFALTHQARARAACTRFNNKFRWTRLLWYKIENYLPRLIPSVWCYQNNNMNVKQTFVFRPAAERLFHNISRRSSVHINLCEQSCFEIYIFAFFVFSSFFFIRFVGCRSSHIDLIRPSFVFEFEFVVRTESRRIRTNQMKPETTYIYLSVHLRRSLSV